jgi:DNA-binding transcriptional LysR family regulator
LKNIIIVCYLFRMKINDIDIKQLRYFIAVAEELSFTRASKRLHMSQPPLTQHIIALEYHLGITLLNRTKRHVSLTPAGAVFLAEAKKILQQIQDSARTTINFAKGIKGKITIGVNYSSPLHPVTNKILQEFKKENPEIEVNVILHDPGHVGGITDFDTAKIDFTLAWIDNHLLPKSCQQKIISKDHFCCVLSKEHPLAEKQKIKISDLEETQLIIKPPTDGTLYYQIIDKIFAENGKNLKDYKLAMVRQLPIMASMVSASQGVAFIPDFIKHLSLEGVVWKKFDEGKGYSFDYTCIYPKKSDNPARNIFLNWLERNI